MVPGKPDGRKKNRSFVPFVFPLSSQLTVLASCCQQTTRSLCVRGYSMSLAHHTGAHISASITPAERATDTGREVGFSLDAELGIAGAKQGDVAESEPEETDFHPYVKVTVSTNNASKTHVFIMCCNGSHAKAMYSYCLQLVPTRNACFPNVFHKFLRKICVFNAKHISGIEAIKQKLLVFHSAASKP